MNIFVLDEDPVKAAQYQMDVHCTKMVLETAQLLCATFSVGLAPYRRTHYNHPCSIWTRSSRENWDWLLEHGLALGEEFLFRYGHPHASTKIIEWCKLNWKAAEVPAVPMTAFAQAMPDEFKQSDPVAAYRAYYRGAKAGIAKWNKNRPAPEWWCAA